MNRNHPQELIEFTAGIAFLQGRRASDLSEFWLNWLAQDLVSNSIVGQVKFHLTHRNTEHISHTQYSIHFAD